MPVSFLKITSSRLRLCKEALLGIRNYYNTKIQKRKNPTKTTGRAACLDAGQARAVLTTAHTLLILLDAEKAQTFFFELANAFAGDIHLLPNLFQD